MAVSVGSTDGFRARHLARARRVSSPPASIQIQCSPLIQAETASSQSRLDDSKTSLLSLRFELHKRIVLYIHVLFDKVK